jgi:hypothetical protein
MGLRLSEVFSADWREVADKAAMTKLARGRERYNQEHN